MKPNNPKRLQMLNTIRQATKKGLPNPFPEATEPLWQHEFDDDPVVEFAKQFVFNGGHFHYTESTNEFLDEIMKVSKKRNWKYVYCWDSDLYDYWQEVDFKACRTGKNPYKISAAVVRCEAVVAQNGVILVTDKQIGATKFAQLAPVLIVMVNVSQVFTDMANALKHIRESKEKEPIRQIIQLTGKKYQHPFFEVDNASFYAQEVIVYMVDEVFELF